MHNRSRHCARMHGTRPMPVPPLGMNQGPVDMCDMVQLPSERVCVGEPLWRGCAAADYHRVDHLYSCAPAAGNDVLDTRPKPNPHHDKDFLSPGLTLTLTLTLERMFVVAGSKHVPNSLANMSLIACALQDCLKCQHLCRTTQFSHRCVTSPPQYHHTAIPASS